eukprot:GHVS01072616.1.p1 GENE.GHVS01072616.1~~GHVS01072616.1.p1  ORF type:complete len:913 (+),score=118.88 GHVS01072616.1:404-3142(+)
MVYNEIRTADYDKNTSPSVEVSASVNNNGRVIQQQLFNHRQLFNWERSDKVWGEVSAAPTTVQRLIGKDIVTSDMRTGRISPSSHEAAMLEDGHGWFSQLSEAVGSGGIVDSLDCADHDVWEEQFKEHKDSLPFGPMAVGMDHLFVGGEHVYGLPEHALGADLLKPHKHLPDEPYRLYNLDTFAYEVHSPMALYGSVPFVLAQHEGGRASGLLWANPSETWVTVDKVEEGAVSWWASETGVLEAYVCMGPTEQAAMQQLHALTGYGAMSPMFAFGKHQCRWNYNDEDDVREVDSMFDQTDIPYDVIWLDIEHTDNKKYFSWHPQKFPSPNKMIDNIASKRRRMVTIVDPHLKDDPRYTVFNECKAHGHLVKQADGADFSGWCWPGKSGYGDFSDANVRAWWATKFAFNSYKHSTNRLLIWNDMNEPSVFNGPELTMPKDNLHKGSIEHREMHNLYGMYYHRATFEGLLGRSNPKLRPFVLSRSFFASSQRYGFVWTGDNTADWSHLSISVPMILSAAMAGISLIGADVGGFFGDPSDELLVRWHQLGIWYPFYRSHAHLEAPRREPWVRGSPVVDLIGRAVAVRYSLLPLWYTLAAEYSMFGLPMIRPISWPHADTLPAQCTAKPQDADVVETWEGRLEDSAMFVGDYFYVVAVDRAGSEQDAAWGMLDVHVHLPKGPDIWYDFASGACYRAGMDVAYSTDIQSIPVFVRGGSIVTTKERQRRSSDAMFLDPFTVHIYPSSSGAACGSLYVDDTLSYDYLTGKFVYTTFCYKHGKLLSSPVRAAHKPAHQEQTNMQGWAKEGHHNGLIGGPANNVDRIVVWGLMSAPTTVYRVSKNDKSKLQLSFTVTDLLAAARTELPIVSSKTPAATPYFYEDLVTYRIDVKKPDIAVGDYDWEILFDFTEISLGSQEAS